MRPKQRLRLDEPIGAQARPDLVDRTGAMRLDPFRQALDQKVEMVGSPAALARPRRSCPQEATLTAAALKGFLVERAPTAKEVAA